MRVFYNKETMRVPVKSWCMNPESGAIDQAKAVANHPAVIHWVALMPDTHQGYGMPIGGVACLENAISPASVGVDIGCGVSVLKTGFNLEQFQEKKGDILPHIRANIPFGFHHRIKESQTELMKRSLRHLSQKYANGSFLERMRTDGKTGPFDAIETEIGSLGGGNHYISFEKDDEDQIWLNLHSGSRNIGKRIGDIYLKLALDLNRKWKSPIPNKDLAFLPFDSSEGQEYFEAMSFALDFAFANRKCMIGVMVDAIQAAGLGADLDELINIHHNFASLETHYGRTCIVHRKGATIARENVIGIIPGSMGTATYVVRGKSNDESFHSCSHGAGRRMGRGEAKRTLSMEDFKESMKDVDFRVSENTLDESPLAYKDIEAVMAEQEDLVEIITRLMPVLPMKAESKGRRRRKRQN